MLPIDPVVRVVIVIACISCCQIPVRNVETGTIVIGLTLLGWLVSTGHFPVPARQQQPVDSRPIGRVTWRAMLTACPSVGRFIPVLITVSARRVRQQTGRDSSAATTRQGVCCAPDTPEPARRTGLVATGSTNVWTSNRTISAARSVQLQATVTTTCSLEGAALTTVDESQSRI